MTVFFKPYEGIRPFLFVSYAHRQSDAVVNTIRILHEKAYRLWYDEGIPAGSDWPANIAQHMQSCERVIFFLSARAMESPNCFSEIRTAVRLGKPVLIVRLEDVTPEKEWKDLLDEKQEIPLLNSPEERAEAILRSGFLTRAFRRSWTENFPWGALGLAASLLFFLAAATVLAALASGFWTPFRALPPVTETPKPSATPSPIQEVLELGEATRYFAIVFPDSQMERAIRRALEIPESEIYRWQLGDISELNFFGNMTMDRQARVTFQPDGTCRVNGSPVIMGRVSDLRLIESMVNLEKLALVCQPLEDISPLSGHVLLRELSLAGSTVDDLSALKDLPSLETLHLEHTAVRDLTSLDAFANLKTVTVSRDMLPLTWNNNAAFHVILVNDN